MKLFTKASCSGPALVALAPPCGVPWESRLSLGPSTGGFPSDCRAEAIDCTLVSLLFLVTLCGSTFTLFLKASEVDFLFVDFKVSFYI